MGTLITYLLVEFMEHLSKVPGSLKPAKFNKPSKANFFEEFGNSFLYSAIQSPLDGVVQLVDNIAGTKLLPKPQFVHSPSAEKFGTANWYAMEAGSSLGMLLPLLTISAGVKSVIGSTALTDEAGINALAQRGALGLSLKESALTGFTYGSLFEPSSKNKQNFYLNRLVNGLSSGLVFSTMTAASIGIGSLAKSSVLTKSSLSSLLTNNVVNSILSSVPGGLIAAETNSLTNTGKFANTKELVQSAYTMGIIGAVFGGLNSSYSFLKTYPGNFAISQDSSSALKPIYANAFNPSVDPVIPKFDISTLQELMKQHGLNGNSVVGSPGFDKSTLNEGASLNPSSIESKYRVFTQQDGKIIVKQPGVSEYLNNDGTGFITNTDGKIVQAYGPNNTKVDYSYSRTGALAGLKYSYGDNYSIEYTSGHGNYWHVQVLGKDGKAIANQGGWYGKVAVGTDGSVILQAISGLKVINHLDGSVEQIYPNGYSEVTHASLSAEEQVMKNLASTTFDNPSQAQRVLWLKDSLIERMRVNKAGNNDIALTLHQVNRLFKSGPEAIIDQSLKGKLAEQVLFNASFPKTIDQGLYNTCTVSTLETRMYERSPQNAAKLVADSAILGKYVTPTGKVVDIARTGALQPQGDALSNLALKFENGNFSDIKIDTKRNFANQIAQQTLVNVYYAEHPPVETRPQDVVQYVNHLAIPGDPTDLGERLILYNMQSGKLMATELFKHPNLSVDALVDIYNYVVPSHTSGGNIAPGIDKGFVVVGPSGEVGLSSATLTSGKISHAYDLFSFKEVLASLKNNNKLPAIVLVDPSRNEALFGASRGQNLSHVITVHDMSEQGSQGSNQQLVQFTNQWGSQFNFVGPKAVPVEELYKALL